jgi:hypothetical protein
MGEGKDAMLERIEKLIRLASSPNENEARNAAFLACKLMRDNDVVPVSSSEKEDAQVWRILAQTYRAQLERHAVVVSTQPSEVSQARSTGPCGRRAAVASRERAGDTAGDRGASAVVRIKSRFAGTCKGCLIPFNAGVNVYWRKGSGSVCSTCHARGFTP